MVEVDEESAGVQLKTKMYMEPSKSEMTAPARRIDGSLFICASGPEMSWKPVAAASP